MPQGDQLYNVGGVLLPRPFKIRRLGHFGVNVADIGAGLGFYRDRLGFKVSDEIDFGRRAPDALKGIDQPKGYFMRYGTDHHAFVLFHRRVMETLDPRRAGGDKTINQITWQCGSLGEVVRAVPFFKERGVELRRVGRDMPGSNWHAYVYDPDGHVNELYYGIEQIGWDGVSKPPALYDRGFHDVPSLPQISEEAEVEEARRQGIDIFSGMRTVERLPAPHDVDGVLLPRPFKVTRIGPVKLFVEDVGRAAAFYEEVLGFVRTEEVGFRGQRCLYLRQGTEHHSLALMPKALREPLGLSAHTSLMAFGLELGSYQQLKDAVGWLAQHGARRVDLPRELSPGIDYHAHVLDPDGHCLLLYYYMEQVGWDGRPRPAAERRRLHEPWPDALEPLSDTYVDQIFQGPWG
jgi:catechol 2,3-dioxygenase-like lactoylglutathione lyase family enzyme